MELMGAFLSEQITERIGWVLIHFLWQGIAITALMWCILKILSKASANTRYIAACIGLLLMVAAPIATFMIMAPDAPIAIPAPTAPPVLPAMDTAPAATRTIVVDAIEAEPLPEPSLMKKFTAKLEIALPYCVIGWAIGVAILSVWYLGGWCQLQKLRRIGTKTVSETVAQKTSDLANRLGVKRAIHIAESALVQVPTVIGWLKPVILLPATALTGLDEVQLTAMIAHELAHIKRCDYLINIIQTVVEILGFYHPAIWWMSRQIRTERENCCDDMAVALVQNRKEYAGALFTMEAIRTKQHDLAVAANGGHLTNRISRLAGKPVENHKSGWIPSVVTILLVGAVLITTSMAMSNKPAKDINSDLKKIDYSSVTVEEGVGFDDIVVGNDNCTKKFIISRLGTPDHEQKDTETNGWWLDYRKKYGIDFWLNKDDVLKEIRFNNGFKGKLQSGISISSNMEDVFKAYGKPIEEKPVDDLNKRVNKKLVYRQDQVLYQNSSKPNIGKIYYHNHNILFWFSGNKINQFVVFPKEDSKIEKKYSEALENPEELLNLAQELFENIKNADYDLALHSKKETWWNDFPTWYNYTALKWHDKLVKWICNTFKDNPIITIELGDVFITDVKSTSLNNLPAVPYKLTLKDGGVIEGSLPFRYIPETPKTKAHWQPLHGIDWHLQDNPIQMPEHVERLHKLMDFGGELWSWAYKHEDTLPDSIEQMEFENKALKDWALKNVEYLGAGKSGADIEGSDIIAYDKILLKTQDGTNRLFGDGHVEFWENDKTLLFTKRIQAAKRLKDLGFALTIWVNKNNDVFPDSLEQVEFENDALKDWALENVEYLAAGKNISDIEDTAKEVVAYDKELLKTDNGTNLLFVDGHVEFIKTEELESFGISGQIAKVDLKELLKQARKEVVNHNRAKAIELYKQAVDLDPNSVDANLNLAWLLHMYKKGQFSNGNTIISPTPINEIAPYFEKVLELEPQNGSAMAGLGNIAEENGNIEKAIDLYKKNIEVSGDAADAPMHRLGTIYRKRGEYYTAIKYYDMFLKIHPDAENVKEKRDYCVKMIEESVNSESQMLCRKH